MKREPFFSGIRDTWKVSFGVVTIFLYAFLIFNSGQFVSVEDQSYWNGAIIAYSLFLALIIGVSDARSRLFSVQTITFIPRFLLFFVPSFILFGYLFRTFGLEGGGLSHALASLPPWLFFIHAFMFVVIESTVQVWAEEKTKLRRFGTSFVFGCFHAFVWVGPRMMNILLATGLFLVFSYVNWRFRKNRNDLAPLCGFHDGYNSAQMVALG